MQNIFENHANIQHLERALKIGRNLRNCVHSETSTKTFYFILIMWLTAFSIFNLSQTRQNISHHFATLHFTCSHNL